MENRISLKKLTGVPQTLLIPLRGRYLETNRDSGIINDPIAIEIFNSVDHDFHKAELPWVGQIMVSIRTEIFDDATRVFLKENPDSVVVNLGCGLDTRVHRVDNGQMIWYDLDLPESIEIRKEFFKETDRFKIIAKSVLDFSWIDDIAKGKKTLFIAEGLLNYFEEDDVKKILLTIKDNFPDSELLFEAHSMLITRSWHRHPQIRHAYSMFKWGLESGKILEKWSSKIKFLQEWYYVDRYPGRWKWMRFFRYVPALRRIMKIVHLRFQP